MLPDMGVELAGRLIVSATWGRGNWSMLYLHFVWEETAEYNCWWVRVEGDWWVGRSMFYGTGKWGLEWLHWPVGEGTGWENVKR